MPRSTFSERLQHGPIVFDGAMGTELYRRGHFINKPFEGANLSDPHLVEQIHREYVEAGAQAIETNTFAANLHKLQKVGLDDQHDAINTRAVELARSAAGDDAWVVGAIGPTGMPTRWSFSQDRGDLAAIFQRQASVLRDAGVDAIALETFSYLQELLEALAVVRMAFDGPIIAECAFTQEGATADGARPDDIVSPLVDAGASVVGANCADGPHELYAVAEQIVGHGVPIAIMPNAGYPREVEGRLIYMATPEYFGVYARRMLKLGVSVIGGCCGTTPEHVRTMANAARMIGGGAPEVDTRPPSTRLAPGAEPIEPRPFAERSALAAKIASDDGFVVSVEVNPSPGLDMSRCIRGARMLQDAGVDVINIADGPRASARMSNWMLALRVMDEIGMEAIVHVCTRDRNLLGLQGDLLAYHDAGLRNLVIITGDPPKMGDYPTATAVFDLDSIGLIGLVDSLNRGIDPAGRSLKGQTDFVVACGAEPAALDYDRELRRLEQKIESGAAFIMTQPVYDGAVMERFLDDTESFGVPVLMGLMPLASYRNAEFLHNEVPGMQVPDEIRARMRSVGRGPEARAEGVRIAQEALLAARDRIRGAYIMPPFGRYEAAVEVLTCVGYEIPEAWRDDWRT